MGRKAFTLVELLLAVFILGILATLVFQAAGPIRDRAEKAFCIQNLKSFHTAAGAYVADHKQWPQVPANLKGERYHDWWVETLEPYQMQEKAWVCPTLRRLASDPEDPNSQRETLMSYMPTEFDDKEFTPYRWTRQPWATEVADFHGRGNLILFPDGHIVHFHDYFEEQTGLSWN